MYACCYLGVMCIPIMLPRRHPHFNCYAEELNLVHLAYEAKLDIRPTASYNIGLLQDTSFLLPLHHTSPKMQRDSNPHLFLSLKIIRIKVAVCTLNIPTRIRT